MASTRSAIIKCEDSNGSTVTKTFNGLSTASEVTLEKVLTFGRKYNALQSITGKTTTDRLTTETSGSIDED